MLADETARVYLIYEKRRRQDSNVCRRSCSPHFARLRGLRLPGSSLAGRVHIAHGRLAPLVVKFAAESAAARTRTWDNHVNSVVLYHLSYGGRHSRVIGVI